MPHEHTTSRLPCEIARDEPAAGPGQTWTAQRLAATSNSFDNNAVTYVPFARAVECGCRTQLITIRRADRAKG